MKFRHFSTVLAVFGLMLALAGRADARCFFDPSPPCQAYWKAQAVFVGTVREVAYSAVYQRGEGNDRWNYRRRITRFSVETAYKGVEGKRVEVVTELALPTPVVLANGEEGTKTFSHSDCDYTFESGETYFVYANFNPKKDGIKDGTLAAPLNRTRKLSEAAADTEFVNELPRMTATAKIFGRVVRADRNVLKGDRGKSPLAGIKVTARGEGRKFEALTDTNGIYHLKELPPGKYQVTPAYPAHLSPLWGSQLAQVIARGCAELNFYAQSDARIKGRVLDAEGHPLPGARVDLILADGAEISFKGLLTFTNQEGYYELKAVPPGRFLLGLNLARPPDASAPYPRTYYPGVGSAAQATVISVSEGAKLPSYDLQLLPRHVERNFEIVVTWADGRPVDDPILRLEDTDYDSAYLAMPFKKVEGQVGRYQATGFMGVTYRAYAHAYLECGQMHAEPVKFTLREGTEPINLVLTSPGGDCGHDNRK